MNKDIRKFAFGLYLFGVLAPLSAQQLSISGTVKDPQTVASGVSVFLRTPSGSSSTVNTGLAGDYKFENLGPGHYELSFRGRGLRRPRGPCC